MMNCKHATQLMSQALDRELSFNEGLRLKVHVLICTGCSHYNKQMGLLRKAMQELRKR
jgi:hypothetical protein